MVGSPDLHHVRMIHAFIFLAAFFSLTNASVVLRNGVRNSRRLVGASRLFIAPSTVYSTALINHNENQIKHDSELPLNFNAKRNRKNPSDPNHPSSIEIPWEWQADADTKIIRWDKTIKYSKSASMNYWGAKLGLDSDNVLQLFYYRRPTVLEDDTMKKLFHYFRSDAERSPEYFLCLADYLSSSVSSIRETCKQIHSFGKYTKQWENCALFSEQLLAQEDLLPRAMGSENAGKQFVVVPILRGKILTESPRLQFAIDAGSQDLVLKLAF